MTHEMPEHLPPVPDGYVYAGRLGDYPDDELLYGAICLPGGDRWKCSDAAWRGTGCLRGTGAWHYAAPIDSDLGRKILAERSKPSWADAPEWAEWLAQDKDGDWAWFEDEPTSGVLPGIWVRQEGQKGETHEVGVACQPNPNWKTTLERRPETKPKTDDKVWMRVGDDPDIDFGDPPPDLIIPSSIAGNLTDLASRCRKAGYRIEWDSNGIRGWKE